MQPAKLLQNLCMVRVSLQYSSVGTFCSLVLNFALAMARLLNADTYVFLLFVNMADLKPDILFCEWPGRIGNDPFEALALY